MRFWGMLTDRNISRSTSYSARADLKDHPRKESRRKVLKDGKIVSHKLHGAIDARIRNLSESGALLEIPLTTHAPDSFELVVVASGMLYPAVARWRKGNRLGVEFTGPPNYVALRKW